MRCNKGACDGDLNINKEWWASCNKCSHIFVVPEQMRPMFSKEFAIMEKEREEKIIKAKYEKLVAVRNYVVPSGDFGGWYMRMNMFNDFERICRYAD